MLEKLQISPRSVFEILGIYTLMLGFQAFSLYLMGSSADWNIYLQKSSFFLEPSNYRAIWALMYVFMTVAIWLNAKISHKMLSKAIILCILQIVLTMMLHYMFFLRLNTHLIFYGAILVDLIIVANIFELARKSYIVAAFIVPHMFWAIFLTMVAYQNW
jgi:tryptophan-rich sensory protein